MQDRVVLDDGTTFVGARASHSSTGELMVVIPNGKLINAAIAFSDPKKTAHILCFNGIYKYTFSGYDDMYLIQQFDDPNRIELWLRGGNITKKKETSVPKEYLPENEEVNENG